MSGLDALIDKFPEELPAERCFPQPYRLVSVGEAELDVRMNPVAPRIPVMAVPPCPVSVADQLETMERQVARELDLTSPFFRDLSEVQEFWPRVLRAEAYLGPEPCPQLMQFELDPKGDGFVQVPVAVDLTAKNSTSLERAPASREDFVRGSRKNVPFLPGGLVPEERPREAEAAERHVRVELRLDAERDLAQVAADSSTIVRFTEEGRMAAATEEEEAAAAAEVEQHRALREEMGEGGRGRVEVVRKAKEAGVATQEYEELFQVDVKTLVQEMAVAEAANSNARDADDSASLTMGGFVDPLTMVPVEEAKLSDDDRLLMASQPLTADDIMAELPAVSNATPTTEWAVMEHLDVSNFRELVPEMAIEYPFELDTFQKEAIVHLERGECVFVAAHTSAGKTVVAEYAIALSQKHLTRTLFTSPIKALSNQKFRDFQKLFGDVGLITGDVQLNPEASCLIMTTEILRSMLYRGADLIRDVEFLIFDECHYVSDRDRGVVWEEVIILVPSHVTLIFLSASVPNTKDFASWVGRVKRKKIHVISTMKRPTPLEHYLWAAKDLHKIVDKDSKFLRAGYERAIDEMKKKEERKGTKKQQTMKQKLDRGNKQYQSRAQKAGSELSQTHALINYLKDQDLLPAVIFVYSKKRCESAGFGVQHIDLSSTAERGQIRSFFDSSVARLNSSDRKLPQILRIKELLSRGIGVHHGGILPLVREIIEILFSRGLVKVLFATETFAMGLNMPARSVVFNSLRKHDGTGFRDLLPGEYLQAAGRAGRRGIDKVGTVIVACWHEVPDISLLRGLAVGKAERLESQFRLSYNQILNLLRVEDFDPFDMMMRSFSESSSQQQVPQQKAMLAHAKRLLAETPKHIDSCLFDTPDLIEEYYQLSVQMQAAGSAMLKQMVERNGGQALPSGRVLVLRKQRTPAVLVQRSSSGEESFKLKVLALAMPELNKVDLLGGQLMDVDLASDVSHICSSRINIDVPSILLGKKQAVMDTVKELRTASLEPMDAVSELKMNDLDFFELSDRFQKLSAQVKESACDECPKRDSHFVVVDRRERLQNTVDSLTRALSRENLYLLPEFNARLRVLEQLEYIDSNRVILIKGRVAREINSCDELIATEMIFDGILTSLEAPEAIALLSMLVFEENTDTKPTLSESLTAAKESVEKIARSLAKVQAAAGLDVTEAEYLRTLKPGLMEVVCEWSRGMSFGEIMSITDVLEGSIVRNIVRLEETCREFRSVARVIGDQKLYEKMEQASASIKKDICFCSSLYLTQ